MIVNFYRAGPPPSALGVDSVEANAVDGHSANGHTALWFGAT